MKRLRIIFAGLCLISAATSVAAEGIVATVDKAEATLEDQILLVFEVEGTNAPPRFPAIPDFEVIRGGQSQTTEIINGRRRRTIAYRFNLLPRKRGVFTIPAATVEIGGSTLQSKPITIRIADNPRGTSRDLFIQVEVSDKEPYVGQQVIYTWRFVYRVQLAGARLENQSWEGFLVEKLGEMKDYEKVIGGQKFRVNEIKMALFPQRAGRLSINPSRVICDVVNRSRSRRSIFDDFFSRSHTENRRIVSPPVQLRVRELPPAPPEFTGLIGEFRIRSEVSKAALKVGESSTFTYSVSGRGNAMKIPSPPLPEFSGFKVYDDKPNDSISRTPTGVSGSRSFRKALVPLKEGNLEVPPIRLVYFDPKVASYRTAATSPISMIVTPSEGGEELNLTEGALSRGGKLGVRSLDDDILPLHHSPLGLQPSFFNAEFSFYTVVLFLLPPVLFLIWLVRSQRRSQGPSLRARIAKKQAEKALAELATREEGEALEWGSQLFREYLGNRFDREGRALTAADAESMLLENQLPEPLVAKVSRFIRELERLQYHRGTFTKESLEKQIRQLIQEIERSVS